MQILTREDRDLARKAVEFCNERSIITITPPKASDELTSRMHCAIRCVANQLEWCGEYMTEAEWKLWFVAAVYGQKVVEGPDGQWIVLQKQTRGMSGAQKFDLTEAVYAFGSEHGVVFDDCFSIDEGVFIVVF
jgi:hypothetical protein